MRPTIFVPFSFLQICSYETASFCDWFYGPISDVLSNGFSKLPILSICHPGVDRRCKIFALGVCWHGHDQGQGAIWRPLVRTTVIRMCVDFVTLCIWGSCTLYFAFVTSVLLGFRAFLLSGISGFDFRFEVHLYLVVPFRVWCASHFGARRFFLVFFFSFWTNASLVVRGVGPVHQRRILGAASCTPMHVT